jgi:hypothetical protein
MSKVNDITLAIASAVSKGDYAAAKSLAENLVNEIEQSAQEDRRGKAVQLRDAVFACITKDLHDEATKIQQNDWDARLPFKTGSSLHFGNKDSRWYYLNPSATHPLVVRVAVEIATEDDLQRDRQNRNVQLH